MNKKRMSVSLLCSVFLCVLCVSFSDAVLLVDKNSTADINPFADTNIKGVNSWICDGANSLFQQWFWYRIGDTGPEASIDTISTPLINASDTDFDPGDETLNLRYENNILQLNLTITLIGGDVGSGVSDLMEGIEIINKTDSILDLHFFQYVDFDLGIEFTDESVTLVNSNTFLQTELESTAWVSEAVVVPTASLYEANVYPVTFSTLNDTGADNLNNNPAAGIGDVTWAFQWDVELAPYDSYIISKDKRIEGIPEPATWTLLGLGGLLLRRVKDE